MTENRENTAALDRMLEQMARETPEMPADFHARWTEAIRAEAGEAPRTETGKHREGRRQLRYILSAAAVFIFLIGGTLLTRSMNQTDLVNKPAAVTAAPAEKTDAAVPAMEEANDYAAMAVPEAETDSAPLMAASSAKSASNESSVKAGGGAAMNAEADMAVGAVMESKMAATDSREYAEEADMAVEDAEEENALQMAAPTATETAAPTATAAPTTEPTLAPTAEPTAAPAAESEFVSFLKDLGSFTLKTLAVAAAVAALAFGAAAIHKALKKRGQKKG